MSKLDYVLYGIAVIVASLFIYSVINAPPMPEEIKHPGYLVVSGEQRVLHGISFVDRLDGGVGLLLCSGVVCDTDFKALIPVKNIRNCAPKVINMESLGPCR